MGCWMRAKISLILCLRLLLRTFLSVVSIHLFLRLLWLSRSTMPESSLGRGISVMNFTLLAPTERITILSSYYYGFVFGICCFFLLHVIIIKDSTKYNFAHSIPNEFEQSRDGNLRTGEVDAEEKACSVCC